LSKYYIAVSILIWALAPTLAGAAERTLTAVLADYVAEGLRENLGLRQQGLNYEGSLKSLDVARGAYWPSLSLESRYTRADGGRMIDVPLGPGLEIPLQRPREQQTSVRVTQVLYAPNIAAAAAAARAGVDAESHARAALAATVTRDIRIAYLDWCKARAGFAIAADSIEILQENLRVNQRLHGAGKLTRDQVLRAQSELFAAEQQAIEADNTVRRARAYFNYLLDRPVNTDIELAVLPDSTVVDAPPLANLTASALSQRDALREAQERIDVAYAGVDGARSAYKPQLAVVLEKGTQGETYRVAPDARYGTASIVFSWSIFSGNQTRARVAAARIVARSAEARKQELSRLVELQVEQARDNLVAAQQSLRTALARRDAAAEGFKIAGKKRDAGAISQVEYLDARTARSNADNNLNVVRFDLLARAADLEFAVGAP
jgi:outer membrane protein